MLDRACVTFHPFLDVSSVCGDLARVGLARYETDSLDDGSCTGWTIHDLDYVRVTGVDWVHASIIATVSGL